MQKKSSGRPRKYAAGSWGSRLDFLGKNVNLQPKDYDATARDTGRIMKHSRQPPIIEDKSGDNNVFEITSSDYASLHDLEKIAKQPRQHQKTEDKDISSEKSAFNIMIIMLVLVGLMVAAASFNKAWQFIGHHRFTSTLRKAVAVFEQYTILHGSFPPMAGPGIIPPGMEEELDKATWTKKTPLGGQWDWVTNAPGPRTGIRLYMPNVSEKRMKHIDESVDDGNLNSGRLKILDDGTGYFFAIE
jgi:hypothetical protein